MRIKFHCIPKFDLGDKTSNFVEHEIQYQSRKSIYILTRLTAVLARATNFIQC